MSDHSAATPSADNPAKGSRFTFISRLLARLKKKPAASEIADTAAEAKSDSADDAAVVAASPSGPLGFLAKLRARLRKQPPSGDAEAASPESDADTATAEAEPKPSRLRALFDSPLKIALIGASSLLLILIIVLIVVVVHKKSAKHAATPPAAQHVAPEARPKKTAEPHVGVAATPEKPAQADNVTHSAEPEAADHAAAAESTHTAADAKPSGKLEKPIQLINDPLAAERAKLAEERAALEKERQQLENDRKALAEQAGRALNGSVVGRTGGKSSGSGDIAGKCDLSGDRASLRENLRRCLGLPDKPVAKDGEAAAKDDKAVSGKPDVGKTDKGHAASH